MGTRLLTKIPMKTFQYYKSGDEGINLLQACYENPLFEEDGGVGRPVSAVRKGPRETTAKGNGSTGDYRFDPTLAQDMVVDFKETSKWKRRALYIITGCIVIIATVGILIGIIVSKEERNTKMESTQKGTDKVLFKTRRIDGTLRIIQGPFSEYSSDLQDTHTVAYSIFSSAFIYQMNSIFNASEFSNVYSSTEIVNISSGSVVVNFIIHFHTDVNIVSSTEVHLAKLILDGMSSGPRFFILDWKSVKITVIDTHKPVIESPLPTGQCVPIELRPCINITDYTSTTFPNVLGHTSVQQVTDVVSSKYIDLFANMCYGYSTDFWCSVFNPECKDGNPIPPCRAYCEDVYSGCGDHFRGQFSAILNCSSLPDSSNPHICRSNPYKPGKCIPMSKGLCTDVDYTQISFPNYASHISDMESAQLVQLIAGIQHATHCYQHSLLLACATFMPKCSGTEQMPTHIIPPCRSLCEGFTERCAIFLDIFFSPWPSQINCHAFPDVDDSSVCIGYKEAHEPSVPSPCGTRELVCDNSTCIPLSWRCDDYQDCADNKDEVPISFRPGFADITCAVCAPGTFRCSPLSTLCIENNKRCNGFEDCPLGSDERECAQLGFGSRQGTLSVYNGQTGQWSRVCVGGWNSSWSQLVCTQLGFKTMGSSTYEADTTPGVRLKLGQMKTNAKGHLIQSYLLPSSSCNGDKVVKIICDDPVCGTRPAYFQPMVRIVGGNLAEPGAWPWLVSLHGGLDQKFFCGGSVIAEYWVLTAGHCVGGFITRLSQYRCKFFTEDNDRRKMVTYESKEGKRTDPNGLTLIVGQPRRLAHSRYTQMHEANRIFLFPEYDSATVNNDIALIQLKEPINFNDHVRPVCLPKKNWKTPLGTRCTAAGWGKASEQALDYERAIKQVDLEIVDTDECREAILGAERKVPYQVNQNVICAGGGLHNDACSGDSGGPLLCLVNQTSDVWFIGGIVSWGVGCAYPNVPGVYTDVPKYIDWIEQTTNLTFS